MPSVLSINSNFPNIELILLLIFFYFISLKFIPDPIDVDNALCIQEKPWKLNANYNHYKISISRK